LALSKTDRHRRSDRRKFQDYKVLDPARKFWDKPAAIALSRAAEQPRELHYKKINPQRQPPLPAGLAFSPQRSSDRQNLSNIDDCRDFGRHDDRSQGHYEEAERTISSVIALISNG